MTDTPSADNAPTSYSCCKCCEGIAKSDHVGHGGTVEKDRHDLPCATCEFEERIRPRMAQAWDEGWAQGQRDDDPRTLGYADNPYRIPPVSPEDADRA